MDLSRRRFLTIASTASAQKIVPDATIGNVAPIFQEVSDKYAITVKMIKDAMDIYPPDFWHLNPPILPPRKVVISETGLITTNREIIDENPAWTKARVTYSRDNDPGRYIVFSEEIDKVLQCILDSFTNPQTLSNSDKNDLELYTKQILFDNVDSSLAEEDLKQISEAKVPLSIFVNIIRDHKAPFDSGKSKAFPIFADRYREFIMTIR